MTLKSHTDDEIADMLEAGGELPVGLLVEAARRLRHAELRHLLTINDVVTTVQTSPLIEGDKSRQLEQAVATVTISRKGYSSIRALATRILHGAEYTSHDVRQLAACCMTTND